MRCSSSRVNWALVISSALLYAISFLYSTYCWWCVFVFLIPIFYITATRPYSLRFVHGFVWGLVYWGLVFWAVWHFLWWQTASVFAAVVAACFLMLYLSVFAGMWFWLAHTVPTILITLAYFEFIWRGALIIFGLWHGIPISYPVLPLMQTPALLQAVPHLGAPLMTLCIILFSYCCALILARRHTLLAASAALITVSPSLISWYQYQPLVPPAWLEDVVCVVPPKSNGNWAASRAIMQALQQAHKMYPKANTFILPESALPYPLTHDDYCIGMWYDNAVPDDCTIIIGAGSKENDTLYNSFFVLHNCRITHRYDKTILFPFTENLPGIWRAFLPLHHLFDSDWVSLDCGKHERKPCYLSNGIFIMPYICSELYFSIAPPHNHSGQNTIVCLANDSWFTVHYFKKLLLFNAQLTALMWQQDIVYCSYEHQVFINKTGIYHLLETA